jgi:hypothetical protein
MDGRAFILVGNSDEKGAAFRQRLYFGVQTSYPFVPVFPKDCRMLIPI